MRRFAMLWFVAAFLIVMANFSEVGVGHQLSCCLPPSSGVVDKAPSDAFVAEITFKNTGTGKGTWSVNVVFEGELWSWTGTPQNLTLGSKSLKTLKWNGSVPRDAPIESTARLIVYYDDSFVVLDWWIHVVSAAQLAITSSVVR
jgi:hypothetical protein